MARGLCFRIIRGPAVRPCIVRPSIKTSAISLYPVLSGGISMKLSGNNHVSENRWKGFQGQRSKVSVIARSNALLRRRHGFRRHGVEAHVMWSFELSSNCANRQPSITEAELATRVLISNAWYFINTNFSPRHKHDVQCGNVNMSDGHDGNAYHRRIYLTGILGGRVAGLTTKVLL